MFLGGHYPAYKSPTVNLLFLKFTKYLPQGLCISMFYRQAPIHLFHLNKYHLVSISYLNKHLPSQRSPHL